MFTNLFIPAYIDPAIVGILGGAIVGVVAVAGSIFYSIKRKARNLLNKDDDADFVPGATDYDDGDVIDTLED